MTENKIEKAKVIFQSWCEQTTVFYTNFPKCILNWRPNRNVNSWMNYPLIVNDDIDSVYLNLDEQIGEWSYCSFPPTKEECKKMKCYPMFIIDIVLPHKRSPKYFIQIIDEKGFTANDLALLRKLNAPEIIQIKADWILAQQTVPDILEVCCWTNFDPY